MGEVRVENDWTGRARFGRWLRTGENDGFESRAGIQSVGTASAGGILAPTDFSGEVFELQKSFNGIRRARTRIVRTDHGRDISWPGIDDTGNQAKIVAEGSTTSGTTALAFTSITLESAMYQAGPLLLSVELMQDAEVDVVALLRDKLAERMGRAQESDFTLRSSTLATGPHGLINASSGAVSIVAGSTILTFANLRSLFFSVDPAWRVNGEWMMSDGALEQAMSLTDGQGRPLIEPNVQSGAPQRILGKPVVINNSLPGLGTAGNKPIWFGDFQAFAVRDVRNLELFRFDERYMHRRQIGFMAYQRSDSRPLFSSTYSSSLRPIRCLVTTT